MDKRAILVFGLGPLQESLIKQCKEQGLFTVGVDITPEAECKKLVDAFEVAAGDDFETTVEIAKKYQVAGVITAATDKPLVMMARVAEDLSLPFYSVQTAIWSTDKQQMKKRFIDYGVPCANGIEIEQVIDLDAVPWNYPVIVKPRDNSGSRGVIYCADRQVAIKAVSEAFEYTHKSSVLVEEYIEGQEYSIESMHYHGKSHVVQFTQKITTEFPYNVELGHIQPAELTEELKNEIRNIIGKIAVALEFNNCASHTELKISKKGITVIETSPRLGGDYITSMLTPMSTGVNLEKILIQMSVGEEISEDEFLPFLNKSSGVVFFELPMGTIKSIGDLNDILSIEGCQFFEFQKKIGDKIDRITSSINRYGAAVFQTEDRAHTIKAMERAKTQLKETVKII